MIKHDESPWSKIQFDGDPGTLLHFTNEQQVTRSKVKSNIANFIVKISQATDACNKLLESLLQFLDPSWEYTQSINAVTSDLQSALEEFTNRLQSRLNRPMDNYEEQYKNIQPNIRKWKEFSTQYSRKIKAYEHAKQKYSEPAKLEQAKYEVKSARAQHKHEGKMMNRKLIKLNNDGIVACCKTWFILIDSYTKLVDKMPPLVNRLQNQVCNVHKHASTNSLPAWSSGNLLDAPPSIQSSRKDNSSPLDSADNMSLGINSEEELEEEEKPVREYPNHLRNIPHSVVPLEWDPLLADGPPDVSFRHTRRTFGSTPALAKQGLRVDSLLVVAHREIQQPLRNRLVEETTSSKDTTPNTPNLNEGDSDVSLANESGCHTITIRRPRSRSSARGTERPLSSFTVYQPKWRRDGHMIGVLTKHRLDTSSS